MAIHAICPLSYYSFLSFYFSFFQFSLFFPFRLFFFPMACQCPMSSDWSPTHHDGASSLTHHSLSCYLSLSLSLPSLYPSIFLSVSGREQGGLPPPSLWPSTSLFLLFSSFYHGSTSPKPRYHWLVMTLPLPSLFLTSLPLISLSLVSGNEWLGA